MINFLEHSKKIDQKSLVISIVSHGHTAEVKRLLENIAALRSLLIARVILTLNLSMDSIPDTPKDGWPFILQIRRNSSPIGFGANHNSALQDSKEDFVCILNPDVMILDVEPFAALMYTATLPGVGCAYPEQVDIYGRSQDHARELPTPQILWRRRFLGRTETRVDWVNAACLVLPQPIWLSLGGFDESYFMYCEDVDLCLRIRLAGLALVRAPVQVVHSGQRASHRRWSHLKWHMRSLLRLWRSPVYRQARQMLLEERQGAGNIGSS